MPLYFKGRHLVEAVQVPLPHQMVEHGPLIGLFYRAGFHQFRVTEDKGYDILTLRGPLHAAPGDWIVKRADGVFYPCKADSFAVSYISA